MRWLDPVQLAGTAKKAVLSQQFATYADEREMQVALVLAEPARTYDGVPTKRGSFVILGGDEVYPTARLFCQGRWMGGRVSSICRAAAGRRSSRRRRFIRRARNHAPSPAARFACALWNRKGTFW